MPSLPPGGSVETVFDGRQDRLARGLRAFQQETGLACPPACGSCCTRTQLTVTDLEARTIWAFAESDAGLMADLRSAVAEPVPIDDDACYRCPLYALGGRGGCSVYSVRPTLCRLFGFQILLRQAVPQFNTCRILGEQRLSSLDDAVAEQLRRAAIRYLGTNPDDVRIVSQLDRRAGGDGQARPIAEALRRTAPPEGVRG